MLKNILIGSGLVLSLLSKKTGSQNKPVFIVKSEEDGVETLNHPDITKNWRKSLKVEPTHKRAVLVPCAATKPFPDSPSHKHGYLKGLEGKNVDIYIVSEPLGIVPYEWSRSYPNDAYDFPPKHLTGEAKDILIDRFSEWGKKVAPKYNKVYLALPGHHMKLVEQAGIEGIDASISNCRIDDCSERIFRATSKEYVQFLQELI